MSLKAVTFYKVECDDCSLSTVDLGSEYAAWGDQSTALGEWIDSDQWTSPGGDVTLCDEHAPRCLHGVVQQGDPDEEPYCDECYDEQEGATQ